ncbi:MAG: M1 family metallopeptidase [Pseudomonadota bacterium]|nr:M1 family metallopeptidase [Pseudomonadota bacterium]
MRCLLVAGSALALLGALGALPVRAEETPPPVPQGQLSDAVTPSAYRLDLTVDPAAARFTGHVEIDAALHTPSRFVYMHGRDLAILALTATVAGKSYAGVWKQVDPTGVALVTFATRLPAGPVTFRFDYDAGFQDGPQGMFHVHVGNDWYSWTQFESIDARAAYPGFDQPGYKQPFVVTLRTPPGLTAVSNAPETGVTREAGMDVHHFAPTAPLPTYLLAMMVGPFVTANGVVPPTPERATPLPLRIVSTRENAGKLDFALTNSQPIITNLERYFGQGFPFPKLDQITSPIMPGAMENAGADLYEDDALVLDDNASTAQKRDFGMIVSHELSHQWFGDLVTPAWWDDIWLNESFANWMGYRIGNEWRPDLNINGGALAEGFAAMGSDALIAGRPIHQPITRNAQIDAAFDSITYGKGGHVVAMIAGFMGDDKFRDGVRRHIAAHAHGNATSAQFFAAMADAAGDPRILPAMQSFTDQQGVPLLTFTGSNAHYTVTQSRYVRLGSAAPDTRWGVPMCLRLGTARQCILLDTESMPLVLQGAGTGDGALMPNAGGTGYYRFELPRADWDRLIAASAHLSSGEGLALADSLTASFMAGRADAGQMAELARVMTANPDSYASNAALGGLEMLDAAGMLDSPATAAYHRLVRHLYEAQLAQYGFDPGARAYPGEAAERSQRRVQLIGRLSDIARDPGVRRTLADAAAAWMGGNADALDPVWYGNGFTVWLDDGKAPASTLDRAHRLMDKALASQDALLRPAALHALAHSGHLDVATWLLNGTADPRLRLSERLQLIAGVAATPMTRELGYNYMRDHLDTLLTAGGGIFFSSRLAQVLAGFCSVEKAAAIARDFGPRMAGKTGQLELDRTVERVRDCGLLRKARGAEASAQIARLP